MRKMIFGSLMVSLMALGLAGAASACPPCTQPWTGTTSCTPMDYCIYCCRQSNQCYFPELCREDCSTETISNAGTPEAELFQEKKPEPAASPAAANSSPEAKKEGEDEKMGLEPPRGSAE